MGLELHDRNKERISNLQDLKGTGLIQYNLFNRYYEAPYVDRLNSRIGFEYEIKKGKKNCLTY